MPDLEYHELREAQERAAAGIAANPAIGNIHRGLADRHADMAASFRERAKRPDLPNQARA